jgi:hypothetical protein
MLLFKESLRETARLHQHKSRETSNSKDQQQQSHRQQQGRMQHQGHKTGRDSGNGKNTSNSRDSSKCRDKKNRIGSVSKKAVLANNNRDDSIIKAIICSKDAF